MELNNVEKGTCSCGEKAAYEITDAKLSVYLCEHCMRTIAADFFGLTNLANTTNSDDAKTKPDNLYKDIGDSTFEYKGQKITVDPFVCNDYTPALYYRNTKKYVHFDWNALINIANNLGAFRK